MTSEKSKLSFWCTFLFSEGDKTMLSLTLFTFWIKKKQLWISFILQKCIKLISESDSDLIHSWPRCGHELSFGEIFFSFIMKPYLTSNLLLSSWCLTSGSDIRGNSFHNFSFDTHSVHLYSRSKHKHEFSLNRQRLVDVKMYYYIPSHRYGP